MASSFVLKIDGYEIDSNKCYVQGECVDVFTSEDNVIKENGKDFSYSIKIPILIARLENMGFTLKNSQVAMDNLIKDIIHEIDRSIEFFSDFDFGELKPIVPPEESVRKYQDLKKYVKTLNIYKIIKLFEKCKEIENTFYPSLNKESSLLENEHTILDILFNRSFSSSYSEIYFHPLNTYRILSEIFDDNEYFSIDYTDLVHAGYYDANEKPIKSGYNEFVKNKTPNSLIKHQLLDNEEGLLVEYKEVTSQNPVNTIKNTFKKYVLGFLNSQGGAILWGVSDSREVLGVSLNYEDRDKLKRELYSFLETIEPSVVKEQFSLVFNPIIFNGQPIPDQYCVNLSTPKGNGNLMYFTKSGQTWIRLNGVTKELKGFELFNHIKSRYITNNANKCVKNGTC